LKDSLEFIRLKIISKRLRIAENVTHKNRQENSGTRKPGKAPLSTLH
jgi:hypothetical protein